ncbi:MAG: glycosyltransferase family 2 protein [Bacteroidota bacterium]
MIYVVIPVHNRREFTRNCLLSLQKQTFSDFEIIIVDDGSTDGTAEMLDQEFSALTVLKGDGNLWWTGSVNVGMKQAMKAGATYIMTLNDDTLHAEDFMEKTHYWSQKHPEAVIGGIEYDQANDKIIYGGERLNEFTAVFHPLLDEIPEDKRQGLVEVTHLPGRGLLIPRKVIETIGYFDFDRFPHYYADYDYTYSAYKKGFKVYCNYDARIYTYPEESGMVEFRAKKSLKAYKNHLFSIRGGANLKDFTRFAVKNCSPVNLIPHLFLGYTRRLVGYWIH